MSRTAYTLSLIALSLALTGSAQASPPARPGQLIVGYNTGIGPAQQMQVLARVGVHPISRISPWSQLIRLGKGQTASLIMVRLKAQPGVRYVVFNLLAKAA